MRRAIKIYRGSPRTHVLSLLFVHKVFIAPSRYLDRPMELPGISYDLTDFAFAIDLSRPAFISSFIGSAPRDSAIGALEEPYDGV